MNFETLYRINSYYTIQLIVNKTSGTQQNLWGEFPLELRLSLQNFRTILVLMCKEASSDGK